MLDFFGKLFFGAVLFYVIGSILIVAPEQRKTNLEPNIIEKNQPNSDQLDAEEVTVDLNYIYQKTSISITSYFIEIIIMITTFILVLVQVVDRDFFKQNFTKKVLQTTVLTLLLAYFIYSKNKTTLNLIIIFLLISTFIYISLKKQKYSKKSLFFNFSNGVLLSLFIIIPIPYFVIEVNNVFSLIQNEQLHVFYIYLLIFEYMLVLIYSFNIYINKCKKMTNKNEYAESKIISSIITFLFLLVFVSIFFIVYQHIYLIIWGPIVLAILNTIFISTKILTEKKRYAMYWSA